MHVYNWQQEGWPQFNYELHEVEAMLLEYERKVGIAAGVTKSLPPDIQSEHILEQMVSEAINTSAIEGVVVSRKDMMSSIRVQLGLQPDEKPVHNRKAKAVSEMLLDARQTFMAPLDENRLLTWHRLLMADEHGIVIGNFRTHTEPMQVISGAAGKTRVHFEAPPSTNVLDEMQKFITWFNLTAPGQPDAISSGPVRAAIAHLYFESIHPFEDGNGRIGRAIAEKVLSQHLQHPVLFSLSSAIESAKKAYYTELEKAQRSLHLNRWITWFVQTVIHAVDQASSQIGFALRKTKFFDTWRANLSGRQLKVIQRMLEAGPDGFEGGMNARKYTGITGASKATATRDLQDLVMKGVFIRRAGSGRSSGYDIQL